MNGVENFNSFVHRTLESLAASNQAGPAGALVDYGRRYGFGLVAVAAGSTAGVDQP